ncbi:MAG TPA: hypothetical protein VFF30_06080 [Nitrososphaerales archaeon]|nr:hypothetical protein [Nitrososphaerales archaeon]
MTQGVGSFSFRVENNGSEYHATCELGPMELICLTLYVPSGHVTARSTSLSNSAHSCSS